MTTVASLEQPRSTTSALTRSAVSGVKWTTTSTVIVTLLQLLQLAILARLLEPTDFGLMAMTMVVIGFAQTFVDMGVSNAIIHRQDATADQLSSLYWLNVAVGLILFVAAITASPFVASFYGEPRLRPLFVCAAFIFVITPFGQQFQVLLQKDLRFDRLAKIEIPSVGIGFVVAVLSATAGHGAFSLVWGQLATATASASLLAVLGWKAWRPRVRFVAGDVMPYLSFGLYQIGDRSLNYVAWNLDKVFIGRLLGAEALGVYSVAYQLMVRPMRVLNPIVTRVAFPILAKIQTDDERVKRGYLRMIQVIAFVSMPMYLAMFALADPLITVLLGARWYAAIGVFQILVFLGLGYSLGNPLGSLLLAKGRPDIGLWFNVLAVALYAVAIVVGSTWGIQGVAVAILIAAVGILFPLDFVIRWYLVRMRPEEFIRSFLPFLALGALTAGIIVAVDGFVHLDNYYARFVLLTLLGVVTYLVVVVAFKRRFVAEVVDTVRGQR